MNVAELLTNSLSPDPKIRKQATATLENAAVVNFSGYLQLLCQELSNEQQLSPIRIAAGVAFKNTLTAKEPRKRQQLHDRWINLDSSLKQAIRHLALQTLSARDPLVHTTIAQVVASIASVDLPHNSWPDLLPILLQNITSLSSTPELKRTTLDTLGFICEDLDPSVLESKSNEILTAVVQGARKEEPSSQVRSSAIRALYNSLRFIRNNFSRDLERNYIMQIVCEATQANEDSVSIAAFECLVSVVMLYYDYMMPYMNQGLFQMTISSMRNTNESIALQAIEFWSSVCDEEIDRQILQEESSDPITIFHFARAALPHVLPTLLSLLSLNRSQDADEDEWTVSKSAATCLSLFSNCVQDDILNDKTLFSFLEQNLVHSDWTKREAALMAFASILDGPSPALLEPYAKQALPLCIKMMTDAIPAVRDTASWTLGRICDLLSHVIDTALLPDMIIAILNGLKDEPRIASHCANVLIYLATNFGAVQGSEAPEVGILSPFFQRCVTQLVFAAQRGDSDESNLASVSYQAISALITYAAKDVYEMIYQLTGSLLVSLEETIALQGQKVGFDGALKITDTQSYLCTVLHSIIKKIQANVRPLLGRMMGVFFQILSSGAYVKAVSLFEDVLLTIGSIIEEVGLDFGVYLEHFFPILCQGIGQHGETMLCIISIGLVGDLAHALDKQLLPFTEVLMKCLSEAFIDPVTDRSVKPHILTAFGDIGLAIGAAFQPFLVGAMGILQQESVSSIDLLQQAGGNGLDDVDYAHEIQEGILSCYICILQGMKEGGLMEMVWPYVPNMMNLIQQTSTDQLKNEGVARQAISLLGDICVTYGSRMRDRLQDQWIRTYVKTYRKGDQYSESTINVANWVYKLLG